MPIHARRTVLALLLVVALPTAREAYAQVRTASAEPPGRVTRVTGTTTVSAEGIRVLVTVERFLVRAPTYRAVRMQLAADGPLTARGLRANAVTGYEIRPRVPLVSDGRRCRTRNVHVDADIRIELPEWESHDLAPVGEQNRWLTFLDALTEHENAHRDTTLAAVDAIRDELAQLSAESCPHLVRKVNRVMARAWDALDARHQAIDQSQAHDLPAR